VRPRRSQKGDKSPVTVADFASQAIICAELERALPRDPIVGEEDADTLRHEAPLLQAVVERVAGAARHRERGARARVDRPRHRGATRRATGRSIRSTAPRASCAASSTRSRSR
jgi:3'-phosphoadenosine 5'-phosphosulfate (PAPS) 3'-phosphatase